MAKAPCAYMLTSCATVHTPANFVASVAALLSASIKYVQWKVWRCEEADLAAIGVCAAILNGLFI
jgi:hypothetical protein